LPETGRDVGVKVAGPEQNFPRCACLSSDEKTPGILHVKLVMTPQIEISEQK
jgi:hypothetical protein